VVLPLVPARPVELVPPAPADASLPPVPAVVKAEPALPAVCPAVALLAPAVDMPMLSCDGCDELDEHAETASAIKVTVKGTCACAIEV
jgi:hypothetical protein